MANRRMFLAALTFIGFANLGFAQQARLPIKAAPEFAVIAKVDNGNGEILFAKTVARKIPVQVKAVVQEGNRFVEITKVIYKTAYVTVMHKHKRNSISIRNTKGKVLPDDAWKGLKPGMTVLLATDGTEIDPLYLRIIRGDGLLFVVPNRTPGIDPNDPQPKPIRDPNK